MVIDEAYENYGFIETFICKQALNHRKDYYVRKYCLDSRIYPSSLELEKNFLINEERLLKELVDFNEI